MKKQETAKKIPLVNNNSSVMLVNEHYGEIAHSKWNPNKKILATGGNGDCFVDLWDLTQPSSGTLKPIKQLRHLSVMSANEAHPEPERGDENHYISSIQWSHNGEKLLTSAYDNIARVWNLDGKLSGLLSAQSSLIISSWNKSDSLVASGGDET